MNNLSGNSEKKMAMNLWMAVVYSSFCLLSACAHPVAEISIKQRATEALERAEYQQAYDIIIDEAAAGDAEFQYTVAILISNGFGPQNPADRDQLSLSWLIKSADQGYHDAVVWLADAYGHGWFGLEKDIQAEYCWREVISQSESLPPLCKRPPVIGIDSDSSFIDGSVN